MIPSQAEVIYKCSCFFFFCLFVLDMEVYWYIQHTDNYLNKVKSVFQNVVREFKLFSPNFPKLKGILHCCYC